MSQSLERRGRFLLRSFALTGLTILLVNCGSANSDAGPSDLPDGAPERVVPEPIVELGVTRGDSTQQFHDIRTPFVFNSGQVVVPDGGSNTIRVFSPDGELVRTVGGSGEGPGEFAALGTVWHRGDTIEAWDIRQRRLTRFFPDDSVQVISFESVSGVQQIVPGTLPDGWISIGVSDAAMGERDEMVVRHFGLDGNHRGLIARTKGMARHRTSRAAGPGPLSPRPQFDVANGQVFVAETLTPEIRVLSPSGDSVRTVSWRPDHRPSPDEAARQTIETIIASQSSEDTAEERKLLRSFPVPERVSAFWSFLVDAEGFIWVQPYDPQRHSMQLGGARTAGPGGEWIVFSSAGERLTTIRMPAGLRPTEISSDAVVGISRSEVGVESVQIYPLERR